MQSLFDEFVTLINTNDEALQDAYTLFTETGVYQRP